MNKKKSHISLSFNELEKDVSIQYLQILLVQTKYASSVISTYLLFSFSDIFPYITGSAWVYNQSFLILQKIGWIYQAEDQGWFASGSRFLF